jgi:hypothetical protein
MRASLVGTSPFKGLVNSGKMPATMHSPEMSEDEDRSSEGDVVEPMKLVDGSDEEKSCVDEDEDEEAGSVGKSLVIGVC